MKEKSINQHKQNGLLHHVSWRTTQIGGSEVSMFSLLAKPIYTLKVYIVYFVQLKILYLHAKFSFVIFCLKYLAFLIVSLMQVLFRIKLIMYCASMDRVCYLYVDFTE